MIQSGTTGQSQDPAERGFLRFYYRNRRPTWFGRLSNQAWAYATALGLTSPIVATLQVEDRRDGRLRSTVLVPAHYEGERYLVSMLGDGSEWVKNVRATRGQAFIKRGQTQPVTLIEIPPSDRAPILKAWCQVATSGRQHVPVPYDAPVSAFEEIAADYPVFRIDGADRFGSQAESSPHPLHFLGWVLLLSIPFYVLGVLWPIELPFGLPVSATMIIVPALLATVMTWREQGRRAAADLWRRVGDVSRATSFWWTLIAVLFMPVAMLFSYEIMRVLGLPLPAVVTVAFDQVPVLFAVFFFGAIFEEIGWTCYATEPLQERYGVFAAGLMIGVVWALWHIVPWWIVLGHSIAWVAGQSLATVVMRIVMGWMYTHGGRSLCLAIAFHAMINTSFKLFPNNGSHYDPPVVATVLIIMAVLVAVISPKPNVRLRNAAAME
jgi:membrane protease YdiL (CAAX protease family)